MSDLIPLFGSHTTTTGQQLSGSLAKQAKRQQDEIALRVERAVLDEQARAFHASVALTNAATLVAQAEAHMRTVPAGREAYEAIVFGYTMGAANRISRN